MMEDPRPPPSPAVSIAKRGSHGGGAPPHSQPTLVTSRSFEHESPGGFGAPQLYRSASDVLATTPPNSRVHRLAASVESPDSGGSDNGGGSCHVRYASPSSPAHIGIGGSGPCLSPVSVATDGISQTTIGGSRHTARSCSIGFAPRSMPALFAPQRN